MFSRSVLLTSLWQFPLTENALHKLIPLKDFNSLLSQNGKQKILFQTPEFHLHSAHPEKKSIFHKITVLHTFSSMLLQVVIYLADGILRTNMAGWGEALL